MIDYKKSSELNGMTVHQLKEWFEKYPRSNKRVVRICDGCGGELEIFFSQYRSLCKKCAHNTPESRVSKSERAIQYHIDHPEKSEAHTKFMLAYCKDPEILEAMSIRSIQFHIDQPELKINHSKFMIKRFSDIDERAAQSDRLKKYNEDPKVRNLNSERRIQWHKDHPEWADTFSKNMKAYYSGGDGRKIMSAIKQGIPLNEWIAFSSGDWRDWSEAIYVNEPFSGCHRHHITKTIVVCIPAELHNHIRHNLKTGTNMGEMNALTIQFINGGL